MSEEFVPIEDLYQRLIGKYVAGAEVLTKSLAAKDQYIAKLESENAQLKAENFKLKELQEKDIVIDGQYIKVRRATKSKRRGVAEQSSL